MQRELLQNSALEDLQERLNQTDSGDLIITRVVVRALNTDPSIEAEIREAVEAEKRLEAKQVQVEIAPLRFADNDGSVVVIPANMQWNCRKLKRVQQRTHRTVQDLRYASYSYRLCGFQLSFVVDFMQSSLNP